MGNETGNEISHSGMGRYRIVLADDHPLIRKGLRRIIEGNGDLEIIGEAGDGAELLAILSREAADMAILDISMPNLGGIEVIREIRAARSGAKVLVLTMHKDMEFLYRAISAGADGYLLKEDAGSELFSAIENIRRKKMYVSSGLMEGLAREWVRIRSGFQRPLTDREKEVLKLIAGGKTNREIAEILFISVRTVESHRYGIMEKLSLNNDSALVKYALSKRY